MEPHIKTATATRQRPHTLAAFAAALVLAALTAASVWADDRADFAGAPEGFIPPPLHPEGVELQTKELSPGVYALLSGAPAVDNSGFVVGDRGVLVIDAHINGEMAGQIQDAVRAVTDKPILYLVNTNYHGDHTFGNYAFPAETTIVAHRKTAEAMRNFEHEKEFLLMTVNGDRSVYADVRLRLPDVTFEKSLQIDLGGRVVELHHFGQGNTAGDTVVYVPQVKAAWTGNLILGAGTIPWLIEGNAAAYLKTIADLSRALDIETIIPGHVLTTSGGAAGDYLRYLSNLIGSVRKAINAGQTIEQALASLPLKESYLPAADSPLAGVRPLMQGLHRWNIKKTYLELAE